MHISMVCSMDSFLASALMALVGCPEIYQRRAVLAFMACDMFASIAAGTPGIAAPSAAVLPAFAAAFLALTLTRRWPLLCLLTPLLLSVDNLAVGAADFPVSPSSAALDGLWSGAMAAVGFTLVRVARERKETNA